MKYTIWKYTYIHISIQYENQKFQNGQISQKIRVLLKNVLNKYFEVNKCVSK